MNIKKVILLVCGGISFVAHASQMHQQVPLALEGKYTRLMQRLSAATAVDEATRKEATDLITRLNNYEGGELQAGLLTQAIARLTAPQQQQEKQEKEKQEREDKACQTEIASDDPYITIHAGRIGDTEPEKLDKREPDPIGCSTYAELIEQQEQHGDQFIIARIFTFDNQGNEYPPEYYEAHAFNQWRFGNYPLSKRQLNIVHPTSPKNRQVIQNSVQYFRYDPKHPTRGFTLMFTEEDLLRGNRQSFYSTWLDANQNFDPAMKARAQFGLGQMYYEGRCIAKDRVRALNYFEQVASQMANLSMKLLAQSVLSMMYYRGEGGVQDYARARTVFEQLASQTENRLLAATAQVKLGKMYYVGEGGIQDYAKAREYLQTAANQTHSVKAQKAAQELLKQLTEAEAIQKTEQNVAEQPAVGEKRSISAGEPAAKRPRKDNNGNNNNNNSGVV